MLGFIKRRFSKDRHYYRLIHRTLRTTPRNIELYKLALVHRSASIVLQGREGSGGYGVRRNKTRNKSKSESLYTDKEVVNNERLEFLGDAVLGAISAELVFIHYPNLSEGGLTQIRSRIVSRDSMNHLARRLTIDREIIASPTSLLAQQQNILGDVMEALIGALYLDKGYDKTSQIVLRLLDRKMNVERISHTEKDFKSRVIEWAQKQRVEIEFQTDPAADYSERTPTFQTTLMVDGQTKGIGVGRNKKIAEQRAAKQLFDTL